ncbi:MAG: hypothetical protein PHV59_10785 [Victivallales bacterium]|nr:hypothetical protein [Victivallales bacterium]
MKPRNFVSNLVFVLAVSMLSGCCWFDSKQPPPPQMHETAFNAREEAGPIFRIRDRNDVREVIALARSLSRAGRYKEAADIYLDAGGRFKSGSGNFAIDCKMAAVREYWLAGDLQQASRLLDELEAEQDIYNLASESDDIRKLRKLLRESEAIKKPNR